MSNRRRLRRLSKWSTIPIPPPGSRYRGYLRYSERDLHGASDKTTFELQRIEISRFAQAHGWVCSGWDEEPAISGAAEEIHLRPAFQKHLSDAASGQFDISLCFMTDRWARDTAIGLESLKRLRRAGIYWATSDSKWDINKVIEDGFSIAFVVDAEVNASYARKSSQKALAARRERARAGYHNGRITWGYVRPTPPPTPPDAPYNWRPPRKPAQPHPVNFERLQHIGEWAAAGLSDRAIADRAAHNGWILEHRIKGVVSWGKPFIYALLTNNFPREFAPGCGHGTILTPDGERIEGKHIAAWDWSLWHQIDEARALNQRGTRGRAAVEGHARLFSGLVICSACGRPLHHQLRRSPLQGAYGVYLCAASDSGYACPLRSSERYAEGERGTRGFRGIRSDVIEDQFAALVLDWQLPDNWRELVGEELNRNQDNNKLVEAEAWRASLQEERKRVLMQHRFGRISDEEMLEETARIDAILAGLPTAESWERERQATFTAANVFTKQRDYWDRCTPEQRAEALHLILEPAGMVVDIATQAITQIRPRAPLLPTFRIVLADRWRVGKDGWLVRTE